MKEFLIRPWPWWFSGIMISVVMFSLIFFGKQFSCSSNFRTICAAAGAGKRVKFFDYKWKKQTWNLLFLLGAMIGGFIAHQYLYDGRAIKFGRKKSIDDLHNIRMLEPELKPKGSIYRMQPEELFGEDAVFSLRGFSILAIGGLLVGFGTRYAGGCTSGHAISGLSNLQLPSLVSVIGFFIGGLLMVHFIFPFIFK